MKKCICCRYTKSEKEFGKSHPDICLQCLHTIKCNPHWYDEKWLKENVRGPYRKA